jgi:hypothetical protein
MNFSKMAAHIANKQSEYQYFHLSMQDHGKKFTFTPKVPDDAFHDDYGSEDFTTDRVCLAPSVDDALESLPGPGEYHVYAVRSADVYAPEPLPEYSLDNPMDEYWNWGDYSEWKGLDYEDEEAHAETVRGRIPDPHTGEVWSLQPITMEKVGRTNMDGSVEWL